MLVNSSSTTSIHLNMVRNILLSVHINLYSNIKKMLLGLHNSQPLLVLWQILVKPSYCRSNLPLSIHSSKELRKSIKALPFLLHVSTI